MERLSTFSRDPHHPRQVLEQEESAESDAASYDVYASTLDTTADLSFQEQSLDFTDALTHDSLQDSVVETCLQGPTLQDALNQVPQLLLTCVSHSFIGLRGMRLVCKDTAANTSAIKEATRYCIKLSSQPSLCEPLPQVAKLLEHCHLESLRVEVLVQTGRIRLNILLQVQKRCRICISFCFFANIRLAAAKFQEPDEVML